MHVEFYLSAQGGTFDAYGTADVTPGLPCWASEVELAVAEWRPLPPCVFVGREELRYGDAAGAK